MHAYNANDAVRHFTNGTQRMRPCTYRFPTTTFAEAVDWAQTATDMYLGLLAHIQQRTAARLGADAQSLVYVLAQALAKEGQQSGWLRSLRRLPPAAAPFATTATREFALGWVRRWVVPGSCPDGADGGGGGGGGGEKALLPVRVLPGLEATAVAVGDAWHDGNVTLVAPGPVDAGAQRVAFVNGALVPTVVPFTVLRTLACSGDRLGGAQRVMMMRHGRPHEQLEGVLASARGAGPQAAGSRGVDGCVASTEILADMPYARNVMHGLVIMAVVETGEGFTTPQDVADKTAYGPALLEWG